MEATKEYIANIEYLIRKYGTQDNLASELGIDPTSISRNKQPKKISPSFLERISDQLGYDCEDILQKELEAIDKEILNEYYAYFFTTRTVEDIRIDTAKITIDRNKVDFTISLSAIPSKTLNGKISIDNNLIYLNMSGIYDKVPFQAYITLPYYRFAHAYMGGLGLIMLPTEGTTLPCAHKIVLSCIRFDLSSHDTQDYRFLCDILMLDTENQYFQKVSRDTDAEVYKYIKRLELQR